MDDVIKKGNMRVKMVFLPVIILLMLILIVLYNFGISSKQTAKSVVQDEMTATVSGFASQICDELDIMTRMGIAFRDMLATLSIVTPNDALPLIGTLCNNSSAYMVVYCDANGIGATQSGIKVNLSKDKFLKKDSGNKQYYAYLQKERIMQAEALVSVIPVVKQNVVTGYIVMYYSVSHIRKLFTKKAAYQKAFMILSVDNGIVITTEGIKKKIPSGATLDQVLNILNVGQEHNDYQSVMKKKQTVSTFLFMKKDHRYVISTPIGINDWYIAIGFKKEVYDKRLNNEWSSMRNLITCLVLLILTFIIGMIAMTRLIRIRYMNHNKTLRKEADMDMLTGLYNKMATERMIKRQIMDASDAAAVFFVLDIDNFKGINDSAGHSVGDYALRNMGKWMKENYKEDDILGRAGGDEFIIFVRNLRTETAIREEVRKAEAVFKSLPKIDGLMVPITISIGAAVYPMDGFDFEELYKAADMALYQAKKNGKNQLVQR
jgi:diguanylate cyclase (GGDEF) domain